MKKIFTLFSAACVAATGLAVEKEMAAPKQGAVLPMSTSMKAASGNFKTRVAADYGAAAYGAKKISTRDGEATASVLSFRPADSAMAFSLPMSGNSGYACGFVSPYGNANFYSYSVGVPDATWKYAELNDFEVANDQLSWNFKTSTAEELSIKSGVGMFRAPVLSGTVNGQAEEYSLVPSTYYAGGFPSYFLGDNAANIGLTFYQNTWLADFEGYQGEIARTYAYAPGVTGFEASGAASDWYKRLQNIFNTTELSDLELQNFTIIQPQTASPYIMSTGWLWASVQASAATQLMSYIYPMDETGLILTDSPIALGYAAIPAGESSNIVFEYDALDEDGDESEEDIIINGPVAVTVEGFNGNTAIQMIAIQCGFYPFSYAGYLAANRPDYFKSPDLYANLSLKVNGQAGEGVFADMGMYYMGPAGDEDTLSLFGYAQFAMDAIFPWIVSENGEESVTLPLAGGEASVNIDALFYNIAGGVEEGFYEVSSSDWINVTFGESSYESGLTPLTVSVEASEASRVGAVEISGYGITYSLKVIQGEDNAVSSIVIDKNAEYYDLQGRKVANPDKGIYIKKTGNKSEKVIL